MNLQQFVFCIIIGFAVLLCFFRLFFLYFRYNFSFFLQVQVDLLCMIIRLNFMLCLCLQVALCHQMGLQVCDQRVEGLPACTV